MNQAEVQDALLDFVREEFLHGDVNSELELSTPLLEWGILDSLRTAVLLAHIRKRFNVHVSLAKINARNFRDIRSIAALVFDEAGSMADNPG